LVRKITTCRKAPEASAAAAEITIDGELISRYDVHHLRRWTAGYPLESLCRSTHLKLCYPLCRHIGIVSQDNVLFSTSIKENIIYGMGEGHLPTPTDEELWEVCVGLGRIVALYHRSSTSYQTH
jgi:hypothetical protein